MYLATVLLCHVLGAIGVGPIFTLPLLAKTPTALHDVFVLLCFGAGATLVSGIILWVVLKSGHPVWLEVSSALFFAVILLIGTVLEPAVVRSSDEPKMHGRIRWAGITSSVLVLCIAALMVLRPGES
jgi:hypothetical protein